MLKTKNYTLREWMDLWLNTYAGIRRKPATIENYVYARMRFCKHFPNFEKQLLNEVDSLDFQDCFSELGFYSKSSLTSIKAAYSEAYKRAIRERICTVNPLLGIELPPEAGAKKIEAMTKEEQEAFEKAIRQMPLRDHLILQTFLLTGLRRRELQTLRWCDWNMKQNTLTIRESKTVNGIRTIPLHPEASMILRYLQAEEASTKEKCEYVFSHNGKQASNEYLRYICSKAARIAGIRHITPHILRHTFATRLIENGADAKSVSLLLGHADVKFTLSRYVSPDQEHLKTQILLLNSKGCMKAG